MGVIDRARSFAEERLGVSVVEREELDSLRESMAHFEAFKEEASELAYHSLDYFSGRPQELRPEARKRLAQRSRIALMKDPLAGAEADHLANFSFGKGLPIPEAADGDPDVQMVIDTAWNDSVNREKLTGFEAQRHRSHELLTQAELFPAAFIRNGKVRIGFLDADRVVEVICDPDDDERPLWYVYDEPARVEWDFAADRWKVPGEGGAEMDITGRKLRYYPHWRNVEEAERERRENNEPPLPMPAEGKLGKGLVYHGRTNRIGRTQRGCPPWARTLRFYSAMNQLTEAHVNMAQAASTFVAKRVMKGSPETVARAANAVLAQTGELGAARFGPGPPPHDMLRDGSVPPPAGSVFLENETHRLESLQLQSGAGQAQQTATVVRAPISAASGFGQHYLGDASNANLATATSLELPALMTVEAWQETMAQIYRWFTDIALEAAVRAGTLGGYGTTPSIGRTLAELRLEEAEDRKEAERRTEKKLSYSFSMPFPGRKNLPDVVSLVTQVKTIYDPNGQNIPLQRQMLLFLATHGLQVEDPAAWVDEVLPAELEDAVVAQALAQQTAQAEQDAFAKQEREQTLALQGIQSVVAGGGGDDPQGAGSGEVPKNTPQAAMEEFVRETDALFAATVVDPLLVAA